jgi:AAA ATPase domain
MPLPTRKAKTLKEAYRICDVKPLESEDMERYYVPLEVRNDAIANVNSLLDTLEPGEAKTILLTGHVGSGKSSELVRLARGWTEQYEITFLQAEKDTDVNDVEYTDLYLLIIKQVEVALRQHGLKFRQDLVDSFEKWFREVTEETEETVERSINVEAEASLGAEAPFFAKLLFKLMANIKAGSKDKRTIREVLRQDVSRLKTDINLLLTDGLKKLQAKFPEKKGFLVIIDGLDKCPRDVAERLFFDYAPQLQDLACVIIYTVPIGSLYTPRGIGKSFEDATIIPMVKIYKYDPHDPQDRDRIELDHLEDGLQAMADLIRSRVEVDQIFTSPDQQLLDICKASGGHPRFLMQIMRTACLTGNGRGHAKLLDEDITYAVNQLQFRFERELVLISQAYAVLAEIARTKELTKDDVLAELLFSTAVLEYNGNQRWAYPNPAVRRSDLFKRAVQESSDLSAEPANNG